MATHDESVSATEEAGSRSAESALYGETGLPEKRYRLWSERAYHDLIRSSERRQLALKRLDKIESTTLALTVAYSMILTGLSGWDVWLNRPGYYLGGVAGTLAVLLGAIKVDINRRRLLLLKQEQKSENCLRILEAVGLVEDMDGRAKMISEYINRSLQDLASDESQPTFSRRSGNRTRS